MSDQELLLKASQARATAYAPYSGFKVGATLVTDRGNTYSGSNVENASLGATNCAERTAVFKAISEGEQAILAIAVVADGDGVPYPCGICLQVLAEFGTADMRIICGNSGGEFTVHTLGELLPHVFSLRRARAALEEL
jgi:cytidine deaminase